MSVEGNKAIAAAVVERVANRGDLAAVEEYYAAGYIEHDVLPPGVSPGREGMKQLVGMFRAAFPDLHYDLEDVVADGDKVVQRVTGHGTPASPPPSRRSPTFAAA
jgi:predicted SnoaL-like aldol condensation-catalyzing enzyme